MIEITFAVRIPKGFSLRKVVTVDEVNAISELTKDLQKMRLDPEYLDCTIICKGVRFQGRDSPNS
jgi:hypothetical protein